MISKVMISFKMIEDLNPISSSFEVFKDSQRHRGYDELFQASEIVDAVSVPNTLWLLGELHGYDKVVKEFAFWCADRVKDTTDDVSVHECLKVVRDFLDGEASLDDLRGARLRAAPASYAGGIGAVNSYVARAVESNTTFYTTRAASTTASIVGVTDEVLAQKEKLKQILDAGEWINE